jgi:hypothetical protein
LRVSRQKERRIDKTERPGPLLLLLGGGFLGGQDGGAVGAALGDLLIDGEIDLLDLLVQGGDPVSLPFSRFRYLGTGCGPWSWAF